MTLPKKNIRCKSVEDVLNFLMEATDKEAAIKTIRNRKHQAAFKENYQMEQMYDAGLYLFDIRRGMLHTKYVNKR